MTSCKFDAKLMPLPLIPAKMIVLPTPVHQAAQKWIAPNPLPLIAQFIYECPVNIFNGSIPLVNKCNLGPT